MLEPQFAGYEIVKYRPEFRNQILELQTHMWSPNLETNAAYLSWKYYDNPFIDSSIIYLALHEGQVVGMRAMFGTCWQGGRPNKVMCCLSDADAVIHPEHRRRGLLERMTAMTLADLSHSDYEYVFTLSANQFSSAHNLKLGWRSVGFLQPAHRQAQRGEDSHVRRLVRSVPVLPSAYRRLRGYIDGGISRSSVHLSPFAALDNTSIRTRQDTLTHILLQKEPKPDAMAELVERIGDDGRIRHVRDQRFFAWRFQNPLSEYRCFFWEGDRLEGYLILQIPIGADEGEWITIVDWEATSMQVRADLLRAAIQWGNFGTLTVWTATLQDEAKKLLQENGFHLLEEAESPTQAPYQPSLLVRSILSHKLQSDWMLGDRRLLDMSNWDLRAIYSDNF